MAGLRRGRPPRPFTPRQEDPGRLEQRTVGRATLLAVLAERLAAAATGRTRPHTLLVGPRGSGKTHLLRVALNQLSRHPEIAGRLAIADLDEDAVGITRYTDLLREIAGAVGVLTRPDARNAVGWEEAIVERLGDRTLLLVVENLDKLFKALGTPGQRDLRSWVETSGRVLILAATPALFDAVKDRTEPWFGGLILTPVEELSADEGHELLSILARDAGDEALAEYLGTDVGRGRVDALAQLTGGSARIWMVLAEFLTVDSLDELIPAVEDLIEGLVPYYQQLVWDLPANHQAIVRQLAEGDAAALTPAEIAAATDLSQQTVGKALGLLQEGRWVRSEKLTGGDQRQTYYRLREPMLRHHFQWRRSDGQLLALIVGLLRTWYYPDELRRELGRSEPLSPSEAYLVASLPDRLDTSTDHDSYARDPLTLRVDALQWLKEGNEVYSPSCARYAEACALIAADPAARPAEILASRAPAGLHDERVAEALAIAAGSRLDTLLLAAGRATEGDTAACLISLAAGVLGVADSGAALDVLRAIDLASLSPAVALELRSGLAYWIGKSGDHTTALTLYRELLPNYERAVGPNHSDTLTTRHQIAYYTGETCDPTTALTLYRELLPDRQRVLGPNHPHTLATRSQIAYWTGETGDPTTALTLHRELLPDEERVLGPNHPHTLTTRHNIAHLTGKAGDPTTALTLYRQLLPDRQRVLGPDHPDTLTTRHNIAYWTGQTGDPTTALTLCRELLPDQERVLGPNHPHTLTTRHNIAAHLAEIGRTQEAVVELWLLTQQKPDYAGALVSLLRRASLAPTEPPALVHLWGALHGNAEDLLRLPQELQVVAQDRPRPLRSPDQRG